MIRFFSKIRENKNINSDTLYLGKSTYQKHNKNKMNKNKITQALGFMSVGILIAMTIVSVSLGSSTTEQERQSIAYDDAMKAKQSADMSFDAAKQTKCNVTRSWANQGLALHYSNVEKSTFTQDQVEMFLAITNTWNCDGKQPLPLLKLAAEEKK